MNRYKSVQVGLALLLCWVHYACGSRLLAEANNACNATDATWTYESCDALLGNTGYYGTGGGLPGFSAGGVRPALRPGTGTGMPGSLANGALSSGAVSGDAGLGFKTGGAQDIENFRKNVAAGYLPLPTDLTYEGIVKDYFFETSNSNTEPCTELFCPIYSVGLTPDPLLGLPAQQFYMAVGLDSGMKAADFARKKLNLVVVLDVSGSMGSTFDTYYYDGKPASSTDPDAKKSKMDVAKEVLLGIVERLAPQDSLGVVLFSSGACVPKGLAPLNCTDVDLKAQIQADVVATSSTNMEAGIQEATKLLKGCPECMAASRMETENRIIFVTDAQPNQGSITEDALLVHVKDLAADGIYMTLIGVGLDFNTELVESITKVKGANYYSVHTPGEFKARLNEEFDYAVTPLVFDLTLKVAAESLADGSAASGWKILHVYGSPNPNDTALSSDGGIMKVHTLFPSPKTEEGIKGGVVLLRLQPPSTGGTPLVLEVTYEDREGKQFSTKRTVEVPAGTGAVYESSGVRKAVALALYKDILQGWLLEQWTLLKNVIQIPGPLCRSFPNEVCAVKTPAALYGRKPATRSCTLDHWLLPTGCILPPPDVVLHPLLGRWERQSQKLAVSALAGQALQEFLTYFEAEVAALKDATLAQEVAILKKLVALGRTTNGGTLPGGTTTGSITNGSSRPGGTSTGPKPPKKKQVRRPKRPAAKKTRTGRR